MREKNVETFYPLSPMQQGMLFHSLLSPESGVYVEQVQCTLRGDLQVAAFERAWQAVMARHAVLRTSFIGEKLQEPVQVVHSQVPVPLEVLDWRHLPGDERQARLEARAAVERARGFDLSQAPLMRLTVIATAPEQHAFLWTYHHILLDGWSQPLLTQEVFALYETFARGGVPRLPPPPSYRDYIVWLRRQDLAAAEAFWRDALQGFVSPTPLVVAGPPVADDEEPPRTAEIERTLSPATTAALQDLARRHGVTLSTLVQGAWAVLLSRYSGEQDVVFGVTVSGRPVDLPGAEAMVGLFINTLPLRVQVADAAPLGAWLKGLHVQQGNLQQYQYTPLVQIHGWSEVPRSEPLFESILVFENYPVDVLEQSPALSLRIENIRSVEQTNYPLTAVAGAADELMLKLIYDGRRFDAGTVRRMVGHWATLLEGMITHANRAVEALPLLTEAERRQMLVDWQATATPFPEAACVPDLFEAQVDRTPDAVALTFMDQALTYRELDARANQLAHHLQSLGVGPEVVVGICVERSLEMLVGVWGILKAGGAYLPLDPSYPPARLAFMLRDTAAPIVLTQQRLLDRVSQDTALGQDTLGQGDVHVLCLDRDWPQIAAAPTTRPVSRVSPDHLAYVIYTSGSTGQPKGTLLEHRGLTNFVTAYAGIVGITAGSQVLQFFAFGFDGSIMDFFPGALVGATLHLVPHDVLLQPETLSDLVQARGITHVVMTPSMLAMLPERLPQTARALWSVAVGGEACPRELVARWVPAAGRAGTAPDAAGTAPDGTGAAPPPDRHFFNFYGPTEVTVAASYYTLTELPDTLQVIPIGRPLPNVRLYVLDAQGRPVPVGVPGELYIGGAGVARGYLNHPELTAERFVSDPFSGETGARLYRTGDRVRYLPDGNLEFLGRIDHQVKLRGFRVELGEIEAVLVQQPGVRQAVVAIVEGGSGSGQLVAYVVPEAPDALDLHALQAQLAERLPPYMVPSTTVTLDRLPLSPSGKVDRRALPAPGSPATGAERTLLGPRDALELRLTRIWEEILGVQPIGVEDDFFELGGHSLLAMRLIAVVQQQLGVNVPILALFQEPTIEQLAATIRRQDNRVVASSLVPIQPKGSHAPLFFIHPSGGSVHWYADLARRLGKEWPFYGIQARGLYGDADIHTRIEEMAASYVDTLRSVQETGPYFLGSWSMGVIVAFEMAQQLRALGQEVRLLALLDQGPVLPKEQPEDAAAYLVDTFGQHIPLDLVALRQLDPEAQIAHVWKTARDAHWLYPDVTLAQFSHFIRILQTHTDAWRAYTPRPYPGRVTLFRAQRQSDGAELPPDMGWADLALGGVRVIETPGDHLSMIHNPHARVLARKLRELLMELDGR